MIYYNNPRNLPIHCFPYGIRQAILAMHAQTKAPLEINVASALAALAIATQHLTHVQRPSGPVSPTSLALLTLGVSGDRKTSSDDAAFVAIKAFEIAQMELHRQEIDRHEIELVVWKAQRDGIALQIKQLVAKDEPTEALVAKLKELQDKKPKRPQATKLLYADTTPEALAVGLYNNSPSAALVSNEASKLLFGPAMSNLSLLSELWSGGSVPIDRVSSPSFVLDNHVLSTSLMIQPSEFGRYMKSKGGHMRGSGYLARCLPTLAQSIQGYREIFPGEFVPTEDSDRFHARITEMLQTNGARPTGHVITFDPQAAWAWTGFFNETERLQREGYIYADVGDFASKIADNAARLAAIFSVYEGKTDHIGLESIQQAIEISKWYLGEFKMLFGSKFELSEEQQNTALLEQWASRLARADDGCVYIERSKIMQFGPNRLRGREQLNKTLDYMGICGRAAWWTQGRKIIVKLGPWMW